MKKFLIVGYTRSGTHRVKEYIYKNINTKIKFKSHNYIYDGLIKKDIFLKKKKFYIFNPLKKNKYEVVKKQYLLKKKILSTHKFYEKILIDFVDYCAILTIRDPSSVIISTLLYVTKPNILKINKQYKVKSPFDLIRNEKYVFNLINEYNKFYENFLIKKNLKITKKFKIIDYKENINKKLNNFNFKNYKLNKSTLHSTSQESAINKKLRNILKKKYDFEKSMNIYKSLKFINLKT